MLNDYFSSVFNTPAEASYITTNYTNTNNEIGSTPATSSEETLHNFEIGSYRKKNPESTQSYEDK